MIREHYVKVIRDIKAETPDFNEERFGVLIADDLSLDGKGIASYNISNDRKFACVIVPCEEGYEIKTFEIEQIIEQKLLYGDVFSKAMVYLLRK